MRLHTQGLQTLEQVRAFVEGSQPLDFELTSREEAYEFIAHTLRRFGYRQRSKPDKGLLRRFLILVTGLSRAQITRLISRHYAPGKLKDRRGPPARPFPQRYSQADVRALADLDTLHGNLCGPATRKLCERAWTVFGDSRYQRLAQISNGHLYNLRSSERYHRHRGTVHKTQATAVPIGERRRPHPEGRPGFLRVDTVHQGDYDGLKGVYHINLVDEVTQHEFIGTVPRITENFLIPLLEGLIQAFPFAILAFHADNGSEYINRRVAKLLEKLRVEQFTKSRARRTNDNALVESKNGSVIRKHLGYGHIPAAHAQAVDRFNQHVLSPYLNFHRPCHFPTEVVDDKGKVRKRYRYADMMTPYEKLKSLPAAHQYLKPGMTFEALDEIAYAISDNEAARQLNEARRELFEQINQPKTPASGQVA